MSIVSTSTIWQLVCPVTAVPGLLASSTTRALPPNFTPTSTFDAIILRSAPASAMSAVEGQITAMPTGTRLPPDTIGGPGGPRLAIAVPIHTTLIVEVFPNPIPSPIYSFRPNWAATDDGSLISGVYRSSAISDHGRIILMGFLLAVFIRNVVVSIGYLRKGRARDKTLFYLLLASQLWGPVAFIAIIVGILSPGASCTSINLLTVVSMEASSSLLVTGILGIKAYRCLNRSKFVLVITWALQVASIVLFCLDLVQTSSTRAFNGTCAINNNAGTFIPAWISIMFSETGFLSLCFLVAVWRSSASSAAQGRMSLAVSFDSNKVAPPQLEPIEEKDGRRGWWDYVDSQPPFSDNSIGPLDRVSTRDPILPGTDESPAAVTRTDHLRSSIKFNLRRAGILPETEQPFTRLPSTSGPYHGPRIPSSTAAPVRDRSNHAPSSPAVGRLIMRKLSMPRTQAEVMESKWSKRLPNMLRMVIRNELFYTTAVTLSCCISAIAVSSAARTYVLFSPLVWLQVNWAVTSVLVMQSYSQVVERHQREKLLAEPILAATQMGEWGRGAFARNHSLQPSLAGITSRGPHRRRSSSDSGHLGSTSSSMAGVMREFSNPFADFSSDSNWEPPDSARTRPDSVTRGLSLRSNTTGAVSFKGGPAPNAFDATTSSPTSQSRRRSLRATPFPPGPDRISFDTPSIAVTSSTNLRSPTSASFDHAVNDGGGTGGVVHRPKSQDWNP